MNDETPNAPTSFTEESISGAVLHMLQTESVPEEQSFGLTTSENIYSTVKGFLIGVIIALALIALAYIVYRYVFDRGDDSAE